MMSGQWRVTSEQRNDPHLHSVHSPLPPQGVADPPILLADTTHHSPLNQGFSFVELLITLLVLAAAVVPLMQLYATATEEVMYTDDLRTALDLAREEVEKVKNLALTENQIKRLGNVVSPPISLNKAVWYTVRMVNATASPLELQVLVYRDRLWGAPVTSLVTIINK